MGQHEVEATFNAIDNISNVSARIADAVSGMAGFIGDAMQSVGGDFEETGAALSAFAGGPLSTLQFGIATFVGHVAEVDGAMDNMSARLGRGEQDMQRLKTAAEDVFKTGLVGNFQAAANAVEATSIYLDDMTKEDFSEFTRRVSAVADAFGDTPKGVTRAVTTLIDKFDDLKGDPFKSLDLIVRTAQDAHRPLKEIEGVIERYSGKFAASGLSALGMGGMIVMASQAGIGASGMGALATAIDTFHDKLAKPPWAVTNALKKLGLGDVVQDLKANKISMDEALDKVLEKFKELPDGPNKAKLAIDLFGPSIDKLGGPDALGKLAGFSKALDGPGGISGAAKNVADTLQDDGTLGSALKQFWATAKTNFEQGANDVYNILTKTKWDEVLTGVMNRIKSDIQNRWNETKAAIDGAITNIRKGIEDGWNNIVKFVQGVVGDVRKAFQSVADAITGAMKPVLDMLQGIIDKIAAIAMSGLGGAAANVKIPGFPGKALGGPLDEGFTWVGEEGPELAYKRGASVDIFSNRESRSMVGSSSSGARSSGPTINQNGTYYIVGAGGMADFIRQMRVGLEAEDNRLGRLD